MIIGHPGHELRAYNWLERYCPKVFVLTDGSGSLSEGRIDSTRIVVEASGASCGRCFGAMKDANLYQDILVCDASRLAGILGEIYDEIISDPDDTIVIAGDGIEGYNTAHDLTRYVINILCERLRKSGRRVENLYFNLVDNPAESKNRASEEDLVLTLSETDFSRKMKAALAYPELKEEVEMAIARAGEAAFKVEVLFRVPDDLPAVSPPAQPVYYEEYGKQRVAEGKYQELILYDTHIRPLTEKLEALSE